MNELVRTLEALEVELHHPGVRCDRARLEHLLHPSFHEVGRSGRQYSRDTVIDFLLGQVSGSKVRSEQFQAVELSAGVVLLTYRSAHEDQGGALSLHTLRSSVWVLTGSAWQLRYHQGTAAAQPW